YGNNVEFNVAGAQYSVTLTNVEQSSLTASNFVFGAGAAYTFNLPLVPSIVETGSALGEVMDFSSAFEGRSIEGLGGDDTLIGTWTSDHLYGGDGNDTLNGDYGNDALYGGDGNNTLNGSGGDDYYVINTDTDIGVNTIEEFEGTDTLVFEGSLTTSDIDIYQGGLDLILEGVNNTQSQYWVVQITNTFFTGLGYDAKVEYVVVQDVVYDLDDVFNTGIWTP
ncbi:MAG: hypothetical protein JKY80_04920, partial [Mariprofundaceae bacterium]|nr:hypothetical protein [Mariprofundaceae bacterium]